VSAAAPAADTHIFLIAGEPSGDALGAELMAALKRQTNGRIRFSGIGGAGMTAQGLASLFPMEELSMMGLLEILPRAPRLLRRIGETVGAIERSRPNAVVTIDAPGFCFRVAARLKKLKRAANIPVIHYVAPQVWAWRKGRARKLPRLADHLLTLLPFEPPYFEIHGLDCTFVGHPAATGAARGKGPAFRARHGIAAADKLLCLLPGSRAGEVSRLLPIYRDTAVRLGSEFPGLRLVVAAAAPVAGQIAAAVSNWPLPVVIARKDERYDAMSAADIALAASGTVTLEVAREGTPMVVAYRMNPVTAWLARLLVRIKYVTLINLVLGREAIPELLLEDCTAHALATALGRLLRDEGARSAQRTAMAEALRRLAGPGPSPGERAAAAVLKIVGRSA